MNQNLETEWMQAVTEDGATWFLMAENDYLAENYWAEVAVDSPHTWKVGMGTPFGTILANGKATTPEQAKLDAEQAWKRAVQDDLS